MGHSQFCALLRKSVDGISKSVLVVIFKPKHYKSRYTLSTVDISVHLTIYHLPAPSQAALSENTLLCLHRES